MPKLRKNDAQRRAERFSEHYRVGKAKLKLLEPQIADMLGIGQTTLKKYKHDPLNEFSVEQLISFGHAFGWTDAEYLDIIHGGLSK